MNVLALHLDLVRTRHVLVEDLFSNRHQTRMRYPRAVVSGFHFPKLVLTYLVHRGLVRSGIIFDRDLRGHTTHSVDLPLVTSLNEQVYVRLEESLVHRHFRAIRKNHVGPVSKLLDVAEDVIPPAAVQPAE
jgi:hypothetical protein